MNDEIKIGKLLVTQIEGHWVVIDPVGNRDWCGDREAAIANAERRQKYYR